MNKQEASYIPVTVKKIDILEMIEVIVSGTSAIVLTILFISSRINKDPNLLKKAFRFLQLCAIGVTIIVAVMWLFVLPQVPTKKIQHSNRLINYIQKFFIILLEFLSVIQWFIFVSMVWLFSKIYLLTQTIAKVFSFIVSMRDEFCVLRSRKTSLY